MSSTRYCHRFLKDYPSWWGRTPQKLQNGPSVRAFESARDFSSLRCHEYSPVPFLSNTHLCFFSLNNLFTFNTSLYHFCLASLCWTYITFAYPWTWVCCTLEDALPFLIFVTLFYCIIEKVQPPPHIAVGAQCDPDSLLSQETWDNYSDQTVSPGN